MTLEQTHISLGTHHTVKRSLGVALGLFSIRLSLCNLQFDRFNDDCERQILINNNSVDCLTNHPTVTSA